MIKPIDIYRTAKILIEKHGDNAEDFALNNMRRFLEEDDAKASGVWLAIASAITDLQKLNSGERLH